MHIIKELIQIKQYIFVLLIFLITNGLKNQNTLVGLVEFARMTLEGFKYQLTKFANLDIGQYL